MKKYKSLLIIVCLMILTGCTVKYDLKITDKTIEETAEFVQDSSLSWDKPLEIYWEKTVNEFMENNYKTNTGALINSSEDYYTFEKVEGVEYYKKERILDNTRNGIKYLYDFNFENYDLSKIANYCYDKFNFTNKDKIMKISTSSAFNCFTFYEMLEKVEVNITTSWDYKIISSNADKVEDGKYTWIITKENASNKPIEIEIKKVINWRLLLIILVPSIAIIAVVYFIIKRKIIKNNQI